MTIEVNRTNLVPLPWIEWAIANGTGILKRCMSERYPSRTLLLRELGDHAFPEIPGLERTIDIGNNPNFGDERQPNEASFAVYDRLTTALKATQLPERTELKIGRIHRVSFWCRDTGEEVLACGVLVSITCDGITLNTAYVWARNDRPAL